MEEKTTGRSGNGEGKAAVKERQQQSKKVAEKSKTGLKPYGSLFTS